jgi:tRNA threonylcarbamoyl adenosine modification protein YeaZ
VAARAVVLVVDTSTPAVTAAAVDLSATPRLLAAEVTLDARRHGELLTPSIAAALATAGVNAADLAAVVAGLGPGPYTGLRVGLVTAAALSDALGIPAYGVCSLDGIAGAALAGARSEGARAAGPTVAADPAVRAVDLLLAATDARRREVYWATYDGDGGCVDGPGVDRPADLAARLAERGVAAMAGAGARMYADVLALPLLDPDHPDPVALAAAAADRVRGGAPADPLTPLYLRRPDAAEPGRPKALTPA